MVAMFSNGFDVHSEDTGYLFVRKTLGKKFQHFLFSC